MWLWLWLPLAFGQDAISLSVVRVVQEGGPPPQLTLIGGVDGHVDVSLSCGARKFTKSADIHPGARVEVPFTGLTRGQTRCTGELSLRAADGSVGEMPLDLSVEVLAPLTAKLDALDVEARTVTFSPSRAVSEVSIEVIGERGRQLGGSPPQPVPAESPLTVQWDQEPGEVVKVLVHAADPHGNKAHLELSPWHYAIPHEDVVFESNSAEIRPGEVHKMEASLKELNSVMERYGSVVTVQLFVVGHTDTVGDGAHNQALSERRAQALASWFIASGFSGPVWYQGLGERGLAVDTPDNTDEPANRRAVYLVAAEPPSPGAGLAPGGWRKLR